MTLDVWPSIADTAARSSEIAPSVLRGPVGSAVLGVLTDPYDRGDRMAEDIGRAMLDPEDALGDVLDLVGRAYGYDRDGLPDHLYRRLLSGWIGVVPWLGGGAPSWEEATAVWRALVGPGASEVVVRRVEVEAAVAAVEALAVVDFWPSDVWIRRAGAIFGRLVPVSVEWSVTVAPAQALRYDLNPGLDLGLLAWYATSGGAL